ncbi:hypothetical protein GCM10007389_24730 [Pontibacter akesuensis]|nr:hypothetical protein GCM10007389_24730 [Pontibacter akesuensis]
MVTAGDSATGLAGVAVFVPHTTRGTFTNQYGYFSMPVLPRDSVVVSSLGYSRQYILVPTAIQGYNFSANIVLQEKATELPTVDVMPWATERDLRTAISKVKLAKEPELKVDLGPLYYRSILEGPSMDAGANANYCIQQSLRGQQRRYTVPSDIKLFGAPIR